MRRFLCVATMRDYEEQRTCIKFCFKLGKTATETYQMLRTAYGEEAMGKSQAFEWFSKFKRGVTSVKDENRLGRPTSSKTNKNIDRVREMVLNDRRITIRELSDALALSFGSVQSILKDDLNMRRIAAKFVPRLLSNDQKESRVIACTDLKEQLKNDPRFMEKVITGDETWIYGYDPETKQQSSQWKSPASPRPKKARQVRSNVKSMMIVFFDINGIVHKEFVPRGQTVNQVYYKQVLQRLRESVRRKRPEKWRTGDWFLHHDNAPAHKAISVRQFLDKNRMSTVPHPAYSPDLAPADFFLFPRLKIRLRGHRFEDIDVIQRESQKALDTFKEDDFQKCFQHWQKRWDKCINSQGDYFEGDSAE